MSSSYLTVPIRKRPDEGDDHVREPEGINRFVYNSPPKRRKLAFHTNNVLLNALQSVSITPRDDDQVEEIIAYNLMTPATGGGGSSLAAVATPANSMPTTSPWIENSTRGPISRIDCFEGDGADLIDVEDEDSTTSCQLLSDHEEMERKVMLEMVYGTQKELLPRHPADRKVGEWIRLEALKRRGQQQCQGGGSQSTPSASSSAQDDINLDHCSVYHRSQTTSGIYRSDFLSPPLRQRSNSLPNMEIEELCDGNTCHDESLTMDTS